MTGHDRPVVAGVVSPELQPLQSPELSGWGCSIHEYFNTSALPSGWDVSLLPILQSMIVHNMPISNADSANR